MKIFCDLILTSGLKLTISNHFIIIPLAFFPLMAKKSPNCDCCHEFSG